MKAIFISYNQAYNQEVVELLESFGQRGFTQWQEIQGRGDVDGEPHYGNHAWPTMNHAVLTVVPDDRLRAVMDALRSADEASPKLGLRAFAWNVEESV